MTNDNLTWTEKTLFGELNVVVNYDYTVTIETDYDKPLTINSVQYRGHYTFGIGRESEWRWCSSYGNRFRRVGKFDSSLTKSASKKLDAEMDQILAANRARIMGEFQNARDEAAKRRIKSIDDEIAKLELEKKKLQSKLGTPRKIEFVKKAGLKVDTVIPPCYALELKLLFSKMYGVELEYNTSYLSFGNFERETIWYRSFGKPTLPNIDPNCDYQIRVCE